MKIALVTDIFRPDKTSGAVQLFDLAKEFVDLGYDITVIVPDSGIESSYIVENMQGVEVLRLKSYQTKDINYAQRTINETFMSYKMSKSLRKSSLHNVKWDGVIWYSPTIFLGAFVNYLKVKSNCKAYLILRDIFPEWALDLKIIKKGILYYFFKIFANYQYSVADFIGVQTEGNLDYFAKWQKKYPKRNLHVLPNWLSISKLSQCRIDISKTTLKGRKIFVYTGNMGVAQGMQILILLAEQLQSRKDIGFLFVGRGKDKDKIIELSKKLSLDNIAFFDEIEPEEMSGLYSQCDVGLVSLDTRHNTHNIPGKFISYLRHGLPVLAHVNQNNDLVKLIKRESVGDVCWNNSALDLAEKAIKMIDTLGSPISKRSELLADTLYSSSSAAHKISDLLLSK